MILTIILAGIIVLLLGCLYIKNRVYNVLLKERNQLWATARNADQKERDDAGTIKRLEIRRREQEKFFESALRSRDILIKQQKEKIVAAESRASLIEEDAKQRMEEFKKHPTIACMTDGQVQVLAEAVASVVRTLVEGKKEYVN